MSYLGGEFRRMFGFLGIIFDFTLGKFGRGAEHYSFWGRLTSNFFEAVKGEGFHYPQNIAPQSRHNLVVPSRLEYSSFLL